MSARATARRFTVRKEPLTGRAVLTARSRPGMDVVVAPLPEFRRSYAVLTSRCGALDTMLPDGTAVPAGTAHFLEHEMFRTTTGDLFEVFDERGAQSNAFTTHTSTSFLFWCTRRFEENLETLLEATQRLEIDAEDVERERRIIGQELAMYDDDPSWRGYVLLLRALYRHHPVREDIAGTADSVARIDLRLLRAVHAAWYHPRNLVLVVAGAVDPEAVLERADAVPCPSRPPPRHRRAAFAEPRRVARSGAHARVAVSRPHLWVGLKDRAAGPRRHLVRRQVSSTLALEVLFADGGRIQTPLYRQGHVDDSFAAYYESEFDFGHAILSAETEDPDGLRRRLARELGRAARAGVTPAEVERTRRRMLGRRLRVFNAPESLAHWLLAVALEEVSPATGLEALETASARSVTRRLRELTAAPRSWAVLEPA